MEPPQCFNYVFKAFSHIIMLSVPNLFYSSYISNILKLMTFYCSSFSSSPRRRKKKKTVTMAANLDFADVTTDADSPRSGRPPKGHSRSRTTPNLTKSGELDDSQTTGGKRTPRRKRLNMDDGSNVEDSGTEAATPRSARLRRGSRENLLQLDPGSTGKKGGKRKIKTRHLYDDDESVA